MEHHGKYDSIIAAKFMLAVAGTFSKVLNNTQLQKLLFIAYGNYLVKNGLPLLTEAPQAWPYGPVFPRVQKKVKAPGLSPNISDIEFSFIDKDEEVKTIFSKVIQGYSKFSATQLSEWSHADGSPWERTVKQSNFIWGAQIPDRFIQEYFTSVNV